MTSPHPITVEADPVDHPAHYTSHPSGVECITVTEHMNFCRGNAVKYIWRAGEKGNELEDLRKARWYLDREIARLALDEVLQDVRQGSAEAFTIATHDARPRPSENINGTDMG